MKKKLSIGIAVVVIIQHQRVNKGGYRFGIKK